MTAKFPLTSSFSKKIIFKYFIHIYIGKLDIDIVYILLEIKSVKFFIINKQIVKTEENVKVSYIYTDIDIFIVLIDIWKFVIFISTF